MNWLALIAAGYLVGSFPTGRAVAHALSRRDPRHAGSGSTGATNVVRLHGWRAGLVVALADLGKGWLAAAWLPRLIGVDGGWAWVVAGFAAVAGHVWPVLSGFRGGKGVATSGGVVLASGAWGFAALLSLFVIVALASRRASVASLLSALSLPWLVPWVDRLAGAGPALPRVVFGIAAAAAVAWSHRSNIANLLAGREPELGRRADADPGGPERERTPS